MPVPFEALIPLGLITGFFGASGILFNKLKTSINEGQPPRYGLDRWDRVMLDRDYRLTGTQRGQSHQTSAPDGFSTNSAWTLESEHI
ncbi:hypothetical protein BGZ74_010606 [Mortierella antarctica]|uniref:NADH dehydrogenase [ubiquinone] 1 alpha subcomplex subunit 1 n=1 Tax=Podila minutissima TaxID=64525 RepID=A0A9P5VP50_9FUNG|nr:hypothetical protein BGZ74_010606 [Mortierella antarctica]KAF9334846.1 hypothetical protein BG006_001380 [Podila minutissima]KAG0349677.1 hypothetical protein BG005_010827 [Podila minutissima]